MQQRHSDEARDAPMWSSLVESTRVDARAANCSCAAAYGVAGTVTQVIGEPPPGESPDKTYTRRSPIRRWSLSAQAGDDGSSTLDLIWRVVTEPTRCASMPRCLQMPREAPRSVAYVPLAPGVQRSADNAKANERNMA